MFITKITAILAATMISITPISASAAYAPALPYIPPTDVQLFDLIYNAYGVTAPTESADDETRLAGYLDLYSRVLGASNEQFMEDIQTLFTQAKTGRALNISASLSAQLMQGMKEALANGIQVEAPENITDMQGINEWLSNRYNWTYGVTPLQQLAQANGVTNEYNCIVLWNEQGLYDAQAAVFILPIQARCELQNSGMRAVFTDTGRNQIYAYSYKLNGTNAWGQQIYNTTINFGVAQHMDSTVGVGGVYAQVAAQSTDIKNKIDAIALHPITKYTVVQNGVVDDTKPIRIDLPITLPVPADEVVDLPTIQDKMQVVPISDNPEQIVTEMQETATASLGTTGDYQLNLTELFPFCIPFDIARVIGLFVAEPETPVFEFAFPTGYEDGALIIQQFEMDLAALDGVALWVRRGLLAVFVVGLGMVTRQVFLRG